MTGMPAPGDGGPWESSPRPPPPRTAKPVLVGAALTAAATGTGFALLGATLPPTPTPQRVAAAVVQARFDEDWAEAWGLLCRSDRAGLDAETFARRLSRLHAYEPLPSDVDLDVGDVRPGQGPRGAHVIVPVTATSEEPHREEWSLTGDIPLVVEDGALRACFTAASP